MQYTFSVTGIGDYKQTPYHASHKHYNAVLNRL